MPTFGTYSKFVYPAITALLAVLAIVFGADAKVTLAVTAAVEPFVVLFAPKNA